MTELLQPGFLQGMERRCCDKRRRLKQIAVRNVRLYDSVINLSNLSLILVIECQLPTSPRPTTDVSLTNQAGPNEVLYQ
jgi:hypothetical protein